MFCKWCGADLPNFTSHCPRCGKEVPAMSDCGGFYDLVPNAKRPSAEVPAPQPVTPAVNPANPAPAKDTASKKTAPAKGANTGRKGNGFRLLISCIGFIVIIALLVGTNLRIHEALRSIAQINEKIDGLHKDPPQITESIPGIENEETTPPVDDDTIPQPPALDAQDVSVEINISNKEDDFSVAFQTDFEGLVHQTVFDRATYSLYGVEIGLPENETCIGIHLDNQLIADDLTESTISAEVDVNQTIFGDIQGEATYEWEYRDIGSTEWIPLSEDDTLFEVSEDGTTVTYKSDGIFASVNKLRVAELKLTYQRASIQGGSLNIIISGIAVNNQSFAAPTNTND